MECVNVDVIDICERRWSKSGRIKRENEVIHVSGNDGKQLRNGVRIML